MQGRLRLVHRPAQQQAAAVVPVARRRQARQPEHQGAGQRIGQQAPGAPAVDAQRATMGADRGPVGPTLPRIAMKSCLSMPSSRSRAHGRAQITRAGRPPAGRAGWAGSCRHRQPSWAGGHRQLNSDMGGRRGAGQGRDRGGRRRAAGTIHRIIVLKRVIPLNSAARKATLGSEPVKPNSGADLQARGRLLEGLVLAILLMAGAAATSPRWRSS